MRAAVLHGPGDLRVEEVAEPSPGDGEVVLAIRAATTCGTDVKMMRRGHRALEPYPARFGHEFAGEVVACGPGAGDWAPGDAVFCADSAPCGRCRACRRNELTQCEDLMWLMGGFGERLLVPARVASTNLHRLPARLPMTRAPMAEPLACVVRAVDRAGVREGDEAVVVGAGSIGLLLCAVLSRVGAAPVVIDPHEDHLALAARMGAAVTVAATRSQADADHVTELTGGGADHVFEAVGRIDAWESAVAMARPGGSVMFVGGCGPDDHVRVPAARLHYEEVTLRGSFHHTPGHIGRALELLAADDVDWDALIGPAVGLDTLAPMLASSPSCTGHPKQLVVP